MAASRSSLSLFTLTTIIEILLSRSARASKAKHKQNINFFFFLCFICVCYSYSLLCLVIIISLCFFFIVILFDLSPYAWNVKSVWLLSFSLYHSWVLTKRKETNMPYLVCFAFSSSSSSCRWLFDNNNIDYNKRVITTSIRNIEKRKEQKRNRVFFRYS
jgi:hypothetical protein